MWYTTLVYILGELHRRRFTSKQQHLSAVTGSLFVN